MLFPFFGLEREIAKKKKNRGPQERDFAGRCLGFLSSTDLRIGLKKDKHGLGGVGTQGRCGRALLFVVLRFLILSDFKTTCTYHSDENELK